MIDDHQQFNDALTTDGEVALEAFYDLIRKEEFNGNDPIHLINEAMAQGKTFSLTIADEARHSRQLTHIVDDMIRRMRNEHMRVVLIAGPSCSGKTTVSRFLKEALTNKGIEPLVVSLDNYFLNYERRPRDEQGNIDYESFYGIDTIQLGKDVANILAGLEVAIPTYNYTNGQRTYQGNTLQMKDNSILFLEGLHALNPELIPRIPDSRKYRIFVTARNLLCSDGTMSIKPHDNRLLRRIYRDYIKRGASALQTFQWWPGVRNGEEQWIIPFSGHSDASINTAMLFEMPAIKSHVLPLLHQVPASEHKEYEQAQRLIDMLNSFITMSQQDIESLAPYRKFLFSPDLLEQI